MQEKLIKIKRKGKKRLGQGYGSGKGGHTVGRGQKGQKARGSVHILFEGYKVKKSFIKRLPFRRGKGKFNAQNKPIIVKLGVLNVFKDDSIIDIDNLAVNKIVDKKDAVNVGVKILGGGRLERRLIIKVPISNSAASKIVKLGGKVQSI